MPHLLLKCILFNKAIKNIKFYNILIKNIKLNKYKFDFFIIKFKILNSATDYHRISQKN